jgi:nicotinamidase-related amidase
MPPMQRGIIPPPNLTALDSLQFGAASIGRSFTFVMTPQSRTPAYRRGQIGNQFKGETAPQPGEMIIPKRANSAFIAADLERDLRTSGLETLVVAGVSTNNSVEVTVRMAGNLGFQT